MLLMACAICQIALTLYFNIFEAKNHIGIDSSWEYLKVIIAGKENSLFPISSMHGTTHPEIERLLVAVPLYKISGNLFLAYGLSNMIITLLSVYLLFKITKALGYATPTIMIIINLFLCPYLSNGYDVQNELGYYECVNGFSGYYNILVLTFLLVIYYFVSEIGKKRTVIGILSFISLVYISLCKGLGIIVWLGVPIVIYVLLDVFAQNDCAVLKKRKNLASISFIVAMLLGRVLGAVIGLEYLDEGTYWITVTDFYKNLGNILLGFALMLGGIPGQGAYRSPTSFSGLVYGFGILIALVFYVAVTYIIIRALREFYKSIREKEYSDFYEKYDTDLFLGLIIVSTILVFAFVTPYKIGDIFSVRYLILPGVAGFILIGRLIEQINERFLIKRVMTILLFICMVGLDLYSAYFIKTSDNSGLMVDELLASIDEYDADLIYFWDTGKTLLDTERVIRVVDTNRIYKCISNVDELENFGDYKYYDDSTEYNGHTMMILLKDDIDSLSEYTEGYTMVDEVGKYVLYYSEDNPIDLKNIVSNWK